MQLTRAITWPQSINDRRRKTLVVAQVHGEVGLNTPRYAKALQRRMMFKMAGSKTLAILVAVSKHFNGQA
jgi:hypothetical protein